MAEPIEEDGSDIEVLVVKNVKTEMKQEIRTPPQEAQGYDVWRGRGFEYTISCCCKSRGSGSQTASLDKARPCSRAGVAPGQEPTCETGESESQSRRHSRMTWKHHRSFHSRHAVASLDFKCTEYRKMLATLANFDLPECMTCVAMLTNSGFKMDDLKEAVAAVSDDPGVPSPATAHIARLLQCEDDTPEAPPLQDGNADAEQKTADEEQNNADEEQKNADQEGMTEEKEKQRPISVQALNFIQSMKVLELLEPESHDKRVPIRCKICTSANFPSGRVFEASSFRFRVFKHFVSQHCRSATHIAALNRHLGTQKKAGEEEEPLPLQEPLTYLPCEGISLTHGNDTRGSRFKEESFFGPSTPS